MKVTETHNSILDLGVVIRMKIDSLTGPKGALRRKLKEKRNALAW